MGNVGNVRTDHMDLRERHLDGCETLGVPLPTVVFKPKGVVC